jgi:hypothetical protein
MPLILISCLFLGVVSCVGEQEQEQGDVESYSWVRGCNYIPFYAANDVTLWRDFDHEVIDRELGFAARLNLNCVRVFLQYVVFEHDPQGFLESFEHFLELSESHGLRVMPVLFDSCFGEEPRLGSNHGWVANPGYRRLAMEYREDLDTYLTAIVGRFGGDRRILLWDVMNEPEQTPQYWEIMGRLRIESFLVWASTRVRELDPTHPRTIGTAGKILGMRGRASLQDVLSFHCYEPEPEFSVRLREAEELAEELGKPVLLTECVRPRQGQAYSMTFEALSRSQIGWFFWELMENRVDFTAGQGVFFPDGAARLEAAAAVRGEAPEDLEGFASYPLSFTAADRELLLHWKSKPTPVERYASRAIWARILLVRLHKARNLQSFARYMETWNEAERFYELGDIAKAAETLDGLLGQIEPVVRTWSGSQGAGSERGLTADEEERPR